ncbi:MAG: LysR family transcriptional regulator [Myxococcota bacterium]
MADILELEVFHCVVKHGSYVKAAEELALSPSGVSRVVTRLEEKLGARLLQRTTRKLALTEAGSAFYARTAQVLIDLAEAEAEVREATLRPRGTLRLTASVVFGQLHVAPLLEGLMRQYPELSIDLSLTDRFVDLIDEGFDLAIRIGALSDSQLVARRLCSNHRVLVAAPSYLERHGMPAHPNDLAQHQCLGFTNFARPREWRLQGPSGPVTVGINPRFATNNPVALTEVAKRGLGITVGATLAVAPALLTGELTRVLPEYEFEPSAMFAMYPSARQLSTKVRATVDFLAQRLRDPPVWDRSLQGRIPGF